MNKKIKIIKKTKINKEKKFKLVQIMKKKEENFLKKKVLRTI